MILKIKNLSFKYRNELILDSVNLEIDRGDYLVLIGPNGGGKTTLIKLILGVLKPTKGEIQLNCKRVGYVPQYTNFSLDIPIRVIDVVLQGRLSKFKFFYNKIDKQIAFDKLKLVGMEQFLNKKVSDLSGGERQRILIARALVSEPDILILDEPTSAIDIKGQKEIYKILKNLEITKIIISHDINILLEGVNKVAFVSKTLVFHNTPDLHFTADENHFCEIDFINAIQNCKVCHTEVEKGGK